MNYKIRLKLEDKYTCIKRIYFKKSIMAIKKKK